MSVPPVRSSMRQFLDLGRLGEDNEALYTIETRSPSIHGCPPSVWTELSLGSLHGCASFYSGPTDDARAGTEPEWHPASLSEAVPEGAVVVGIKRCQHLNPPAKPAPSRSPSRKPRSQAQQPDGPLSYGRQD